MISERSRTPRTKYCAILLLKDEGKDTSTERESESVLPSAGVGGDGKRYGFSFWNNENV